MDRRLTFKIHAAQASVKLRHAGVQLWAVARRKGASPGAIHHLATQGAIPQMLWGSEVWWTGASHITDQLIPGYHTIARIITGLPKWTPTRLLLFEAGIPPLHLLLEHNNRRYGIRLLLAPDDHPLKDPLRKLIANPSRENGTGLQRIANILACAIQDGTRLENIQDHNRETLPQPIIPGGSKEKVSLQHAEWENSIPTGAIFLYTDGSKPEQATCGSGWVILAKELGGMRVIRAGSCQIGSRAEIEDAEIHAIQEGVAQLLALNTQNCRVYICADNQNALRALSGGPTGNREYLMKCLEDLETLQLKGCRVQGKWTPSHTRIIFNEQADMLANQGCTKTNCKWTRSSLTWLRAHSEKLMITQWGKEDQHAKNPIPKPFARTRESPRRTAQAIARLRCSLTLGDSSPVKPPSPCPCGTAPQSAKHALLKCSINTTAGELFLKSHKGPFSWESITNSHLVPRNMLRFMGQANLLRIRAIITTPEEARDAEYELGDDI